MSTTPETQLHIVPTRTLVLSAVDGDGLLAADPLFDLVRATGHTDKALRDCLARMVKAGSLEHLDGRGRRATYRATAAGMALVDADTGWSALAHRLDAGLEPWDGRWHLLSFEIPERQRSARDALRGLLVELGAAAVHSGLYLHAHDLSPFVSQLARHHHIEAHLSWLSTTDLTVASAVVDRQAVEEIFGLPSVAATYAAVETDLRRIIDHADETADPILAADMISAVVRLEDALRADPMLPAELLPAEWAGASARAAFLVAHRLCSQRSTIYRSSSAMQSLVDQTERALSESQEQFWRRWFPRLTTSYARQLPNPDSRRKGPGDDIA